MMFQSSFPPTTSSYFPRIAAASAASSSSAVVLPGEMALVHPGQHCNAGPPGHHPSHCCKHPSYCKNPSYCKDPSATPQQQRNRPNAWTQPRNIPRVVGAANVGVNAGVGAANAAPSVGAAGLTAANAGVNPGVYGGHVGSATTETSKDVVTRKQQRNHYLGGARHNHHHQQPDSSPERSRPRSNASTRPSTRHQPTRRRHGGLLGQSSTTEEEGEESTLKGKKQTASSSSVGLSHLTLSSPTALLSSAPEWQAQFYRTKLCPFYVSDLKDPAVAAAYGPNIGNATGRCLNGDTCRFAHSFEELRPLPDLRKTKLCASFTKKQACTNSKCPFAHSPEELRTSSSVFYKVTLCNFYKTGRCWNGSNCRFAHGADELRCAGDLAKSCCKDDPTDVATVQETPPVVEPLPRVGGELLCPSTRKDGELAATRRPSTCEPQQRAEETYEITRRPELTEYTTETGRTASETDALKLIWNLSERLCSSSEALSEISSTERHPECIKAQGGGNTLAEQLSAALYAVFMAPQNCDENSCETPLGPPPGLDDVLRSNREWSTQSQSPEPLSRHLSSVFTTPPDDESSTAAITEDLLGLLMQFDTSNAQSLLSPQTRRLNELPAPQTGDSENWKHEGGDWKSTHDWKSNSDWRSAEFSTQQCAQVAHDNGTKFKEGWCEGWKCCGSSTAPEWTSGDGSEKLASLVASYFDEATIQTDEELYDKLLDTVLYGGGPLELASAI